VTKARVLVVDDDHDCRLLLSTIMARAGFEVDAVADGEMAIATLRSRPPDLVLLDAYLPRCDGFQVCRTIKSDPATTHTPVIMLTAFSAGDARERCLAAGADEFVPKPFRADTLLDTIRQLLEISAAAEQLDPGEAAMVSGLRKRPRMG
jgi:DNA-binding response OmpR family regulator